MSQQLNTQRHLFDLGQQNIYLNGAYMSPQLKSVTNIGEEALRLKTDPSNITIEHFYDRRVKLKSVFAKLVEAESADYISIISSVSYGMANVANNVKLQTGDEVLIVDEQFPSNVYPWQAAVGKVGANIVTAEAPDVGPNRGKRWNDSILNSIGAKTKIVSICNVHWADGNVFDLKSIRVKTREVGALLIIDGTQSIGAYPFSIKEIQPDALICSGYKWLMGPYSLGLAYYAPHLCNGEPIEHSWFNRYKSEDFRNLTKYQAMFQPGAERYSAGQSSNFINVPMLTRSIEQILEWQPERIQEYCKSISERAVNRMRSIGCYIEEEYHAHHLFGIYLPHHVSIDRVKENLQQENIFVSYRGNAIRVSPHVYNVASELDLLADVICRV